MTEILTESMISLNELCEQLSISSATGRNWIKLGKIIPQKVIEGNYFFSIGYLNDIKSSIINGQNESLKSRRNKRYVSGNNLYSSYISETSVNLSTVQHIVDAINELNIELTKDIISTVIVYFARQIVDNRYGYLLEDIINNFGYSNDFVNGNPKIFQSKLIKEKDEDILGLLYLSLKALGDRKAKGAYYTPTSIVKRLVTSLFYDVDCSRKTIIDPCCGTGNFILQLPSLIAAENVYASDIDLMSVLIARVNYALKFNLYDKNLIYSHVSLCDYLENGSGRKYDYIIGNPPWGCDFTSEQKTKLKEKYVSAKGTNIESYDVVVEQALSELNMDGILAFVLPEAFLNVKTHTPIRKYLMKENSISYIEYLGEVFDGVQCPSIIVQILHNARSFSTKGMIVKRGEQEFVIDTNREVNAECFNFITNDSQYLLLEKIMNIPNKVYLKDNAQFALGIVTGDNSKYISKIKTSSNEIILKGSDILKYKYEVSGNFIDFIADEFQQVAPIEIYRANEKLLYKFISNKLVFAYDDKQTLSLNSCNILIPQIPELSVKYILAVLNSSVAQFVFKNKFNSIKVLRSHIEQIPIPVVSKNIQEEIENLVDNILVSTEEEYQNLCEELDYKISKIYTLTDAEISMVSC